MRTILTILLLLIATHVWAEEKKVLSIDDFIGVDMDASNNKIYLSISKENDNIIIYDDIIFERTITCKFDKATSKRIYLDCYDPNARYDFFKYPYIKLVPEQYNLKIEAYRNSFNGTGKENYYKYNCDKEEDKDYYTIECKESNWWADKFKVEK